ncbi:kinase-like domain-containing protein [Cinnamomum micranthum f. kanehirae]|uniref:non-specific serine/threonine protein kinase n=1 Tax=Cinnamomum micranthum f. kanehirae TaxID=337451 RepID=A0A443PEI7_9MAGN|nr:kinase-like domain-containing protein [Cinnamomum micranthum f. kanehirae]
MGSYVHDKQSVVLFQQIAEKLGRPDWKNVSDPCNNASLGTTQNDDVNISINITCNFTVANDGFSHITSIILTGLSLPGELPPELANLPYLEIIDLTRNYLNGTIPPQWGSSKRLSKISLTGNRLSGKIPKEIGDITTLQELFLEANHLSGEIPPQLENLTNLKKLVLSSNNFSGALPDSISKLNLKHFKISDNNFTGKIPDFIGSWTELEELIMYASGLDGPIPPGIFSLKNLSDLRISDIAGTGSDFPPEADMSHNDNFKTLVLRNCNLSGRIPAYVGKAGTHLDLSFNNLIEHDLPDTTNPTYIDLSYNNFTWESYMLNGCHQNSVNLFQSTSPGNILRGAIPCRQNRTCQQTYYHLGINCGGDKDSTHESDKEDSGAANYFDGDGDTWGFSSTGNFMDNGIEQYVITANESKFPNLSSPLYKTARLSPLSLTYYGFCLHNGKYHVKLHFAEIIITNDSTYSSLGRRIFDIYIQGDLKLKDFNIKDAAEGSGKEIVKEFSTNVTNNILEIHFYWGGKGTTNIPVKGTYGPLISAITVESSNASFNKIPFPDDYFENF